MTEDGTFSQVSLSVGTDPDLDPAAAEAAAVTPTLVAAPGPVVVVDVGLALPACVAVGPGEKPGHVSRGIATCCNFVHSSIVETFHA